MKSLASEASQWRSSAIRTVRSSISISRLRLQRLFLLRGPAAVDREVGAGDLRRVIAAQEQRQSRDLLRGDELLGRLGFEENVVDDLFLGHVARLHGVRNLMLDQRRPDI